MGGFYCGKVAYIDDGDTLDVDVPGNGRKRIRLAGIDAPEMPHDGNPGQKLASEARDTICRMIPVGTMVDVIVTGEDPDHPRTIGIINCNGRCINAAMVGLGMAEVYHEYLDELPRQYQDLLVNMENEAEANKRGIWGLAFYERPCQYREEYDPPEQDSPSM